MKLRSICIVVIVAIFINSTPCYAQQDSVQTRTDKVDTSYVQKFNQNNVIEFYPGIYSTQFSFENTFANNKSFKLAANRSAYSGIYVNYKWLWFKYSWSVPGTYLDQNIKLKYRDIQFKFSSKHIIFNPFFESYNGLLYYIPKRNKKYDLFRNMVYTNVGMEMLYYFNLKTFSYQAGNYLSEKQIKSGGSVIAKITPQWQQLIWKTPSKEMIKDSISFQFFSSNPNWTSLSASVGYQYNIALHKGTYIISPAVLVGSGLVKELHIRTKDLHTAYMATAWVNAGYNGNKMYAYASADWSYGKARLPLRNVNKASTDFSATVGYRFGDFKKKILGIL